MVLRRRLLLATNNPGKVLEMQALLADLTSLELITPADLGLELDIDESGAGFAENAAIKARAFAQVSGLPALADDSGLEVEALGGAPGPYSNRFFPGGDTDAKRRAALLGRLARLRPPWKARFRSTICLADPDGSEVFAEGECRGEIIAEERGEGGFGYDRIFLIEGLGKTMAELTLAEKNQLSHRARAMAKIKEILKPL
jgi:XTP/dITP diphosphohydrolase